MGDSNKLEDCKKEIRSILIPYQKGCYLHEFNKAYRELIGRRLPAQELGFRSELEFLYSLYDVVKISQMRNGEYHLMGIADEKSKHIQKMVQRQKPVKLRPPPPRYSRQNSIRTYPNLPPRLSSPKTVQAPNLYPKPVPRKPSPPPRKPSPPPPQRSRVVQNNNIAPEPKVGPMQKVISLVQNCNKIAVDDLLVEYQRRYRENLSLSLYGFSSIENCIENIPELKVVRRNNVRFIVLHQEELPNTAEKGVGSPYPQDYNQPSDRIPTPEPLEAIDSSFIENGDCDNGNVPSVIRKNFQMIAERFHEGIWASDFLTCYEEVASKSLDIQELGYNCLSDLIDDCPDIFVRQPIVGSRKDYHIFPAEEVKSAVNNSVTNSTASLNCVGSALVDHIVLNLKRILEAYPEGVLLDDMLTIYSINCKDVLHVEDLGFENLEMFLLSIASRVPLRFKVKNGKKSIHLLKLCDNSANLYYDTAPEVCENEAIPFDAAFPNFRFKPTTLPGDYDSSSFIPVYTSAVGDPESVFIQLDNDKTEEYKKLSLDMDTFYEGSQSELYMMKNIHIKRGASCVAKWHRDGHWYRAEILSIPSMEDVKVSYVDFGTKDTIPKFFLRYAKKEFIELPAQAIPCRLACLKPPNNAREFSKEARNKILSLCEDVVLMARFTDELGPDGLYSIILCNTTSDEDVYINDVLIKENLAEVDSKEDNIEPVDTYNSYAIQPPHQVQIENPLLLSPIQALQAQYYLKCFAAVAPSFAQNESYRTLYMQISAYCPNVDPMQQNIGAPIAAPVVPPGFNTFAPNMNTNSSAFYGANAGGAMSGMTFGGSPVKIKGMSPTVSKTGQLMKYPNDPVFAMPNSAEISPGAVLEHETDIFVDDDDDEDFLQFCQDVTSTQVRHVKRVILSDNFKVHIIVVESKPYASSGDISHLIWNNKEADYLLRRLQHKEVDILTVTLSEDGNEELFRQLERYNVKGVQKTTGFKSSVFLYPLKDVIKILNLFGHPSVTLRNRLHEEISNFNPQDDCWQNFSPETSDSEDDEVFCSETDDDKIHKLCLNDLLLMKESIRIKKKKIMSSSTDSNSSSQSSEIKKLDLLFKKILARIQEVKDICKSYA